MGTGVNNAGVFDQAWAVKLQEMLDEPTNFKEICSVVYEDRQVFNNPYLTDPTVQTGQRGTPYTPQAVVQTNESVTINQFKILPQLIDRADLAQSSYLNQMELAKRQGILLNEQLETAVYADHTNWTNFGAGDITGGTVADSTTITVSASNIDDIVRHVKRVIRVANGEGKLEANGGFVVWRPADFELLEGFVQANGFVQADLGLRAGVKRGLEYMGLTHYHSNFLAANHDFAGVKKLHFLYLLRATYGQIVIDDKDPGQVSGVSITSRVDYQVKTWTNFKPVLLDINVV